MFLNEIDIVKNDIVKILLRMGFFSWYYFENNVILCLIWCGIGWRESWCELKSVGDCEEDFI